MVWSVLFTSDHIGQRYRVRKAKTNNNFDSFSPFGFYIFFYLFFNVYFSPFLLLWSLLLNLCNAHWKVVSLSLSALDPKVIG